MRARARRAEREKPLAAQLAVERVVWNVSLFPSVAAAASAAEPKPKKNSTPPPRRAGCATAGGGGGDGALAVWVLDAGGQLHRTGKTPHGEETVLAWQNRFISSSAPASMLRQPVTCGNTHDHPDDSEVHRGLAQLGLVGHLEPLLARRIIGLGADVVRVFALAR